MTTSLIWTTVLMQRLWLLLTPMVPIITLIDVHINFETWETWTVLLLNAFCHCCSSPESSLCSVCTRPYFPSCRQTLHFRPFALYNICFEATTWNKTMPCRSFQNESMPSLFQPHSTPCKLFIFNRRNTCTVNQWSVSDPNGVVFVMKRAIIRKNDFLKKNGSARIPRLWLRTF